MSFKGFLVEIAYGRIRERIIDDGGVVMGKLKVSRKKEKLIGTIVGVTAIAAPLMVVPGQSSYAIKEPAEVEALQTIVVPLHGTKYIDLAALYNAEEFTIDLAEENDVASIVPTLGHDGIYEIKANEIGTATFTLLASRYEGTDHITDTFKVVVVPNAEDPSEFKFDISKITPQLVSTREQATDLLRNISPITIENSDQVDYRSSNTPPYQYGTIEMIFQGTLGESISGGMLESAILDYFSDDDYDQYENRDDLFVIFNNEDTPFMDISHYESGDMVEYELTPTAVGNFSLDVTVTDHHGGFTNAKIPFEIKPPSAAPQFKADSVLANHFEIGNTTSHVLKISDDAEINLNDIFYDPDSTLQFGVYVEYNGTPTTLDIDTTGTFTWASLDSLLKSQTHNNDHILSSVKKITAFDNTHSLILNVNIEHTSIDPFPASIDMYQSNTAGTSSYVLDYNSAKGFNGENLLIQNSDIQNKAPNSVTAYVYQNDYLKFDFGSGTNPDISKVEIYAHDSNPSILYQDDFNFILVSPEQTPLPNSNINTVQIHRLYPEVSGDYWASNASYIHDFITLETPEYVFLEYWQGTITAVFPLETPPGTGVLLNIDPFDGTKVFTVPFIKPNVPQ